MKVHKHVDSFLSHCIPLFLTNTRTAELNIHTGLSKGPQPLSSNTSAPIRHTTATPVVTMLEDALTDHDFVHCQTASIIVKHITVGVARMG